MFFCFPPVDAIVNLVSFVTLNLIFLVRVHLHNRFCTAILHCDFALQFCIAILHCDFALRFCFAILHCDFELRFCIAILHCDFALRFCIAFMRLAVNETVTTQYVFAKPMLCHSKLFLLSNISLEVRYSKLRLGY